MSVNTEGYLTTKCLMKYVSDKHGRHWSKAHIYGLIRNGDIKYDKIGHQNLYESKEIDKYISTLSRPSSSGLLGEKYM